MRALHPTVTKIARAAALANGVDRTFALVDDFGVVEPDLSLLLGPDFSAVVDVAAVKADFGIWRAIVWLSNRIKVLSNDADPRRAMLTPCL